MPICFLERAIANCAREKSDLSTAILVDLGVMLNKICKRGSSSETSIMGPSKSVISLHSELQMLIFFLIISAVVLCH